MHEVPSAMRAARLPAELEEAVERGLARATSEGWVRRIWERDVTLWSDDPQVGEKIADRLGWLDAPEMFRDRVEELDAFALGVTVEGFQAGAVLGMGGSSLAPEVLARSFPVGEHGVPVGVLDSTDPEAVTATQEAFPPEQTLYLVASKSGTTTETLSFLSHFWRYENEVHGSIPESLPGEHFMAVTDPGRSLEQIPHQEGFRGVFLNPPDVGGRYSALTYVGLVPGALLGVDLAGMLDGARAMARRCQEEGADNPGLALGVAMGELARAGRDKLTLLIEPGLAAFGAWAEQLIAESTGKKGVGIVPVDGEPVGPARVYGSDRVFVRIGRDPGGADVDATAWRTETDGLLEELASAGHPVIDLPVEPAEGLGGEFFRWEFATAVAGAILAIDPFDEPNVTESKENTHRVLERYAQDRRLPHPEPLLEQAPLTLYGDAALRLTGAAPDVRAELERHLERLRADGYISIQAYLAPTPERDRILYELRRLLRDRTGRPVTFGYGPRFLHSTGQLHKGGPRTGCFIQLTSGHPQDLPIPGQDYSFGVLIDAQALGDFISLEGHDLPVLRVHLSDAPDQGLQALHRALATA
jgi:glucose-6-phosphate isomerase